MDVALDREPWVGDSARLLTLLELRRPMAFVAWHTISNLYYLVRPSRGGASVRAFLLDLTRFVAVAPVDTEAFRYAAALPLDDLEDAMQVAAAHACGARVIATRNVADFRRSPVPARTPAELVEELG